MGTTECRRTVRHVASMPRSVEEPVGTLLVFNSWLPLVRSWLFIEEGTLVHRTIGSDALHSKCMLPTC